MPKKIYFKSLNIKKKTSDRIIKDDPYDRYEDALSVRAEIEAGKLNNLNYKFMSTKLLELLK